VGTSSLVMKSAKKQGDEQKGIKKRRQRSAAARNVGRIGALLTVGIVGAFLLFQVVAKIIYPYKLGYQEARKVAALQLRLNKATAMNDFYRSRVNYLESQEGGEMLARHAGYHRPGETAYLIDPKLFAGMPPASQDISPATIVAKP